MKITGLTVEQVIEKLQQCNPKALAAVPGGEGTIAPALDVQSGMMHKWKRGKETAYGMSDYDFIPLKHYDAKTHKGAVEVVYIE